MVGNGICRDGSFDYAGVILEAHPQASEYGHPVGLAVLDLEAHSEHVFHDPQAFDCEWGDSADFG